MLLFSCLRFFFLKGLDNRLPTFLFLSFSSTGSSSLSPRLFDELSFPPLSHWCPVLSHFTTLVQRIYIYDGIFVSSTTCSLIFHFFPKFSTPSEFNKDLPPRNCENLFNFSLPHFIDIELKTLETVYVLKRRLIEFPALLNKAIMSIYTLLQSFTKYSRQTLVFMQIAHYGKNLIFVVFQEFFAGINRIFILAGRRGTRLLFYEVLRLSWFFLRSKSFGNSYIPCL